MYMWSTMVGLKCSFSDALCCQGPLSTAYEGLKLSLTKIRIQLTGSCDSRFQVATPPVPLPCWYGSEMILSPEVAAMRDWLRGEIETYSTLRSVKGHLRVGDVTNSYKFCNILSQGDNWYIRHQIHATGYPQSIYHPTILPPKKLPATIILNKKVARTIPLPSSKTKKKQNNQKITTNSPRSPQKHVFLSISPIGRYVFRRTLLPKLATLPWFPWLGLIIQLARWAAWTCHLISLWLTTFLGSW